MTQAISVPMGERQNVPSTAPMPNARPWRRGQAPQPRSGAPKAQGWTAASAVAAPSFMPSVAQHHPVNSTGANVPINAAATSRIYTILTDTTRIDGPRLDRGTRSSLMARWRERPCSAKARACGSIASSGRSSAPSSI